MENLINKKIYEAAETYASIFKEAVKEVFLKTDNILKKDII